MLPSKNDFLIAFLFSSVRSVRNNSIYEAELDRNWAIPAISPANPIKAGF